MTTVGKSVSLEINTANVQKQTKCYTRKTKKRFYNNIRRCLLRKAQLDHVALSQCITSRTEHQLAARLYFGCVAKATVHF